MVNNLEDRLKALEEELVAAKQAAAKQYHDSKTPTAKHSSSHRKKLILTTFATLLIVAPVAWFGYTFYQRHDSLDASVQLPALQQAQFPIYLPTGKDIQVDESSVIFDDGTITFVARQGAASVAISQQSLPDSLDINKFAKSEDISHVRQTEHALGHMVTGQVLERQMAMIESKKKTLITVTATPGNANVSVTPFIDSLRLASE